jgi:hypothetical protein
MQTQLQELFNNLEGKKIIEIKFGKQINQNCFCTEINEDIVKAIFQKFQHCDVKYFNNKVYYYNNLQLIVYNNGSKKCYKDNNVSKLDILSDSDVRIISKDRVKIDEILFPCHKNYDMVFNRELLSISLKDNLKINIYNKYDSDKLNNYEISMQYLYNQKNKENITQKIYCILTDIQNILKNNINKN